MAVGVRVKVDVDVAVGVAVGASVADSLGVGVIVGVGETVAVKLDVADGVIVHVCVGDGVNDGVCVQVGVKVAVGVGVTLAKKAILRGKSKTRPMSTTVKRLANKAEKSIQRYKKRNLRSGLRGSCDVAMSVSCWPARICQSTGSMLCSTLSFGIGQISSCDPLAR